METDLATPAAWPDESSTRTVNANVPAEVGVPDTALPATPSPAGRAPELIDQWYGGFPPAAPSVTGE
jgi:hypothetical protein